MTSAVVVIMQLYRVLETSISFLSYNIKCEYCFGIYIYILKEIEYFFLYKT